jgi:nucleoside permease NupC
MSATLAILVPIALHLDGASMAVRASSAVLFAAQYVVAAFVARNRAALLVTSVLVPHAAREPLAGDSSS